MGGDREGDRGDGGRGGLLGLAGGGTGTQDEVAGEAFRDLGRDPFLVCDDVQDAHSLADRVDGLVAGPGTQASGALLEWRREFDQIAVHTLGPRRLELVELLPDSDPGPSLFGVEVLPVNDDRFPLFQRSPGHGFACLAFAQDVLADSDKVGV